MRANSPAFGPDGTLLDRERLHFSAGQLPLPHRFVASRVANDPGKVEVTWQYDPGSSLSWPDDKLMMMISKDGKFTGPVSTGFTSQMETAVIEASADVKGIYLFFGSEKRGLYSGDVYFGI